ncbi:MAG: hypothetical protein IPI88_10805 [Chitinophagaceae bacterium]|nr:hypothetical protein [Chitinophagaceae bacterium]
MMHRCAGETYSVADNDYRIVFKGDSAPALLLQTINLFLLIRSIHSAILRKRKTASWLYAFPQLGYKSSTGLNDLSQLHPRTWM